MCKGTFTLDVTADTGKSNWSRVSFERQLYFVKPTTLWTTLAYYGSNIFSRVGLMSEQHHQEPSHCGILDCLLQPILNFLPLINAHVMFAFGGWVRCMSAVIKGQVDHYLRWYHLIKVRHKLWWRCLYWVWFQTQLFRSGFNRVLSAVERGHRLNSKAERCCTLEVLIVA